MRLFCLGAIALVLFGSAATAQPGYIGVYADKDAKSCEFSPQGLVRVHVFHMGVEGAMAAQFRLNVPEHWTFLGDQWNFKTVIGTSHEGVSIAYGTCQESPVYLGVSNFQTTGDEPCTLIWVGPDPNALSGQIEGVDCNRPANKLFPAGSCAYVNANDSCRCAPGKVKCPPPTDKPTPPEKAEKQ